MTIGTAPVRRLRLRSEGTVTGLGAFSVSCLRHPRLGHWATLRRPLALGPPPGYFRIRWCQAHSGQTSTS